MTPDQTQRIELEEDYPPRCILHVRRLDNIETRLDIVERRINGIEDLRTMVQLLVDRVKMLMWLTGVATSGVILGLIGMFFAILQKM